MGPFGYDFRKSTSLKIESEVEAKAKVENYFAFRCNCISTFFIRIRSS